MKRLPITRLFKYLLYTVLLDVCFIGLSQANTSPVTGLAITNYDWKISIDYNKEMLFASCEIEVKNESESKIIQLPFILYRLLKVTSVKTSGTLPLSFTQDIKPFEDNNLLQVNFIRVTLKKPLLPKQSTKLVIDYEGTLHGYEEVGWLYVKDKIDPEFTILRPDCKAYPELGYPSNRINEQFPKGNFNYHISVTLPDFLVVVNGGFLKEKRSERGVSSYQFTNIKKAWRMDICISKYGVLSKNGLSVYYFNKDSLGAQTVLRYAQKVIELYTKWWGPLAEFKSFTIIEIPQGFGSQADVTSILQSSSAFNDSTEMRQLYHELSHLWNVDLVEPSPRWEEGLATFIEYLTIERLENRAYLDYVSDWYMGVLKREVKSNEALRTIPLIDFGKKGMTDYSYSLGMITFRLFYEIVGEEKFNEIIRKWYTQHNSVIPTTNDFMELSRQASEVDLSEFFNDWFITSNYVDLLEKNYSFQELVRVYK